MISLIIVLGSIAAVAVAASFAFVKRRRRLAAPVIDAETGRPMNPNCGLPMPLESCEIFDAGQESAVHECGHAGPLDFKIRLWGETLGTFTLKGPKPKCADCLLSEIRKVSIRCALCGYAIMPGDRVALYVDNKKTFPHPAWKTLEDGQVFSTHGGVVWEYMEQGNQS